MTGLKRRLHWLLPAAFALPLLAALRPAPSQPEDFDRAGFAALPVLHNGRIKPMDTVARSSLLMLRGKQTVREDGLRLDAAGWMLELMARPEEADRRKVIRIDDPDLLGLLRMPDRNVKYYSFAELSPFFDEIHAQAVQAGKLEPGRRSRFQTAVHNLEQRLTLYQRLKNSLRISESEDFPAELESYEKALVPGLKAVFAHQSSKGFDKKALAEISGFFSRYQLLSQVAYFKALPPAPGEGPDAWLNMGEGLLEALRSGELRPGIKDYAGMIEAYRRSDPAEFNHLVSSRRRELAQAAPAAASRGAWELRFNRAQPFYQGIVLYLAVLLAGFLSWLAWPKELGKAATNLLVLAFAVHTAGLLARMWLQGRPPVTNLYSSAVFVGWAAVLLGLVLERIYRNGVGRTLAAAIGFLTLIIAHHLGGSGDTLEMMQAVLDSNFWLGTHVVVITIGYSSTFLAGALGNAYILRGLLSPNLGKAQAKSMAQMAYGIICFATLFSFVGTILGGIWADQSWGRFWGWDPKENGALVIVLWNAVILHARWGGYVRQRGLMALASAGNIFTALSWFGVNMLGIGLHSYGFMDKAFYWLLAFVLAQLAILAAGLLPARYWRSRLAALPA